MATLSITEFVGVHASANNAGFPVPQAVSLPSLGTQKLTMGGTSVQSAVMKPTTTLVKLLADGDCYVTAGLSPTATANDMPLLAGTAEYFGVTPGHKIAVIAA